MAFKLPYFTKKGIANKVTDLPQFRNEDLKEIGIVGRGSFGVVVKTKHLVRGYMSDTVLVKKLLEDSIDDQQEFIKEARMLHSVQHENVVSFKAFCQRPCGIMLEYVCFDFSPFGDDINKTVHSLFGSEFSRHPEGLSFLGLGSKFSRSEFSRHPTSTRFEPVTSRYQCDALTN